MVDSFAVERLTDWPEYNLSLKHVGKYIYQVNERINYILFHGKIDMIGLDIHFMYIHDRLANVLTYHL